MKRLLTESGGGLLVLVIMASLTKCVGKSLLVCASASLARSLAGGPIGCVALETGSAAKSARESGVASEQLNQRMSRAVPLQSQIETKGIQKVAMIPERK